MRNPFENITEKSTNRFSIVYRNAAIEIYSNEHYRLVWPDQRWMLVNCFEDFSGALASSDEAVRKIIHCKWQVIKTSGGPAWLNSEQLQVLGEIIRRKEAIHH